MRVCGDDVGGNTTADQEVNAAPVRRLYGIFCAKLQCKILQAACFVRQFYSSGIKVRSLNINNSEESCPGRDLRNGRGFAGGSEHGLMAETAGHVRGTTKGKP